jgi:hypothetical protein
VPQFINTVAFERRCIRSCCVVPHMPVMEFNIGCRGYPRESISSGSGALLAPYLYSASQSRALPARRIVALGADPIYELRH